MESNELRIGCSFKLENSVLGGGIATIKNRYDLDVAFDLLESNLIKPIPLTEEWLLKFGFEKLCSTEKGFKQNVYSMRNPSLQIYELSKGYGVSFWIGNELKHVHQLQNLYFALTGEELTFKSE